MRVNNVLSVCACVYEREREREIEREGGEKARETGAKHNEHGQPLKALSWSGNVTQEEILHQTLLPHRGVTQTFHCTSQQLLQSQCWEKSCPASGFKEYICVWVVPLNSMERLNFTL